MKILTQADEIGKDSLSDTEIATSLSLPLTIAKYHLKKLEDEEFIYGLYDAENPPSFSIIQKGREYLVTQNLV